MLIDVFLLRFAYVSHTFCFIMMLCLIYMVCWQKSVMYSDMHAVKYVHVIDTKSWFSVCKNLGQKAVSLVQQRISGAA